MVPTSGEVDLSGQDLLKRYGLERYGDGLRRLSRNLAWLGTGEVAVKLGLIVIAVLVARGLGTVGMGIFTVASSAAIVAITLTSFGQVELLIRDSARKPGRAALLLAASSRFRLRVLATALPVFLLAIVALDKPKMQAGLLAFLPYVLLRVEVLTSTAVFKGRDEMDVEVRARFLELGVALVLVIVLVGFGAPAWTPGLALSAGAGAAYVWLQPRLWGLLAETAGRAGIPVPTTRDLARQGAVFLGVSLTIQFLYRHDTMVMAALGLPTTAIGIYGAAIVPTLGLVAVPQMVSSAVFPTFSRRAAAGRSAVWNGSLAAAIGLAVGTACGLALFLLRRPFIALLFGPDYADAAGILAWLAWMLPGLGVTLLTAAVHTAWEQQVRLFWAVLTAFVLACGLNVVVIPEIGTLGAAKVAVAVHSLLGFSLWVLTFFKGSG